MHSSPSLSPPPIDPLFIHGLFLQPPKPQGPIFQKSHFLGQTHFSNLLTHKLSFPAPKQSSIIIAKFDLYQILGGRGLCNGEAGPHRTLTASAVEGIPEDGFGKELLGLTGGFPGGEKGSLKKTHLPRNHHLRI